MHARDIANPSRSSIDGTIGPIRRAELERHLEECAECRALLRRPARRSATPPASLDPLEPPDGVWLQIAGRLRQEGRVAAAAGAPPARVRRARAARDCRGAGPRRRRVDRHAAAAYRATNDAGPRLRRSAAGAPRQGNAAATSPSKALRAEFRLAEQHYQNAIAKLEQAARLDQAAPGTGRRTAHRSADRRDAAEEPAGDRSGDRGKPGRASDASR